LIPPANAATRFSAYTSGTPKKTAQIKVSFRELIGQTPHMDPILKILENDAKTSPETISSMLNMSPEDVRAKIENFEKDKIILAYKAILDEDRTGADTVKAVIEVKLTPERGGGFNRLAERIAKYTEVNSCFLMSGAYDLLVLVEGRSLREVASFVSEKLATLEGVRGTATHFILKSYKVQGVLMRSDTAEERLQISP